MENNKVNIKFKFKIDEQVMFKKEFNETYRHSYIIEIRQYCESTSEKGKILYNLFSAISILKNIPEHYLEKYKNPSGK